MTSDLTTEPFEYAIAGSYLAFLEWRREDVPARKRVRFLAEPENARGQPKGIVHRLDGWERSPAREAAEGLEG